MTASDDDPPLPLKEALAIVRLPSEGQSRRFMGTRKAYLPGSDYTPDKGTPRMHRAAFGGHVYAQAALAVARTWRELEDERGTRPGERLHLHTIHGYFTRAGIPTRPFIYRVTPLTSSRTFSTLSVTAHQPSQPSTSPHGDDHFPAADASLPASSPAFTAICSLKLPEPDSAGVSAQEEPPQRRFAAILASRPPDAWPPAPPLDIDGVVDFVGPDQPGRFPVAVMRKVDMRAYNAGRPVHARRELLLYKLLLPPSAPSSEANLHVAAHAYVADRNGLLMAANHLGLGRSLGRAASLSYSFVMHVAAREAVLRERDGWWIQEASFPRAAAGRGIVESKIWSPRGVHVATEYQDGLIQGMSLEGAGRTRL
ncbi:10fbc22b-a390-49e8-a39a-079818295fe4 [Thermothielavioides terrestris]|uniref:10fbc22b-a390-49e8-a39a-079818295fe4 n=1 Tax=Thermothielavioides terrestris TaxID=2587410 RepID=A0A446BUR3_9PEZI|nr:10fbc22b-a390-49e8-a39a-079818295fe4 [Thermothielavioides terrestris]